MNLFEPVTRALLPLARGLSGRRRKASELLVAGVIAVVWAPAVAHDFKAGSLVIDHPYALPSAAGASDGAVHLRLLKNTGDQPDRLLGARTAAARAVELRRYNQPVEAIELPARSTLSMRHDSPLQLRLLDLKAPLALRDSFSLVLLWQRAGEKQVQITVQQPNARGDHRHATDLGRGPAHTPAALASR